MFIIVMLQNDMPGEEKNSTRLYMLAQLNEQFSFENCAKNYCIVCFLFICIMSISMHQKY